MDFYFILFFLSRKLTRCLSLLIAVATVACFIFGIITAQAIDKARLLALFQVASKQADHRKYMRELAKLADFPTNSNLFKGLLNQHKLMEPKVRCFWVRLCLNT